MSFRARITLAAAAAVAVAVAVVSVAVYLVASDVLYGQVDDELRARAGEAVLRPTPAGFAIRLPAPPLGVVRHERADRDGTGRRPDGRPRERGADRRGRPCGRGGRERRRRSARSDLEGIAGARLRAAARARVRRPRRAAADGGRADARPAARDPRRVAARRHRRRRAARAASSPARRSGRSAGSPRRPRRLPGRPTSSRRIEVSGDDELNRLAATVNTMLASLERSATAQRNLVADASHELRTPLTSIRTNVELLARAEPAVAGRSASAWPRTSSASSRS